MPIDPALQGLLQTFVGEANDLCQSTTRALLALERGSGAALASEYDRLARNLHTLKGTAGTLGMDDLARLAHGLEETVSHLCKARAQVPPPVVDALFRGLDLFLSRLKSHAEGTSESLPAVQPLVAQLLRQAAASDALPATEVRERPPTANTVRRPPSTESGPAAQPAPEPDDGTWRVRAKQIEPLTAEVERLRELRLQLDERRRELDAVAQALERQARAGTGELRARLDGVRRSLVSDGEELGATVESLEDALRAIWTLPLRNLVDPLQRAVRDHCRATGKEAQLSVVGADVAVDRRVYEALRGALVHLVRNAVDHGCERPEERIRRGKHREGALTIRVDPQGNMLFVEVADDGNGLDIDAIRAAALARGLESAERLKELDEAEVRRLIFRPGFSTAEAVTETSGRGVGLDAVANVVASLRGSIEVESRPQQGTRFTLTVPVDLGASPMLVVRSGEQLLGLSMASLEGVVRARRDLLRSGTGGLRLSHGERLLPVHELATLLRLRPALPSIEGQALLIVHAGGERVAVAVDEVLGDRELVIRPLPVELRDLPAFQGASTLARGEVMLVLKPEWLVRSEGGTVARAGRRVLVVDDSLTARAMHRSLLEAGGYTVHLVASAPEALERLSLGGYDALVCDVTLEGMSGLELTEILRGRPGLRGLPVVLVSAHEEQDLRDRARAAGANAFLTKRECDSGKVLAALAGVLEGRSR